MLVPVSQSLTYNFSKQTVKQFVWETNILKLFKVNNKHSQKSDTYKQMMRLEPGHSETI